MFILKSVRIFAVFAIMFALSACVVASSEAKDDVYTIKIGSISAETIPEVRAAYEFKKDIEKASSGRIKVNVFPNGALGGDRQMAEAVSLGTLDMVLTTTSALTTYEPEFGILDMPFAFSDAESAFKAVDGELGQYLNKKLENSAGMVNLGYMLNGVRHMVNSTRPINEPSDLNGLKMRVMESPVYIGMFKALGANPTPMSFTEVYTSLQQKTIDGFEVSANFMVEMKFYEVQKYYSLTGHTVSLLVAAMNKNKFEKLPDDLKKLVVDMSKKWFVDYQRSVSLEEDTAYINKLKEHGMEVNEITPENHMKFVKAVLPLYTEFEEKLGEDVFVLLKKYQ